MQMKTKTLRNLEKRAKKLGKTKNKDLKMMANHMSYKQEKKKLVKKLKELHANLENNTKNIYIYIYILYIYIYIYMYV